MNKLRQKYNLTIKDYLILHETIKQLVKSIKYRTQVTQKSNNLLLPLIAILCGTILYQILTSLCSIAITSKHQPTIVIILIILIIIFVGFKECDIQYSVNLTYLLHHKYHKYKNTTRKIKLTYNDDIKPISMKKLPKYQDIKTFNIPKNIQYLLITRKWYIMLNQKYQIIGFCPRLIDNKLNIEIHKYLINECNIKSILTLFMTGWGGRYTI